ncbi:hypothetical protein CPC08DRAFT_706412 [Agrocybe pediades]|nr:hypothetical protein CPC08DRAFT_706412 [Agrocybe pediades]
MLNLYLELIYWGFLGIINLVASVLVFYATKTDRRRPRSVYQDGFRRSSQLQSSSILSLVPNVYVCLCMLTGFINLGGGLLRLGRIQSIELPRIQWLADLVSGVDGGDRLMEFLKAKWLVTMNDWTSFVLGTTFILAAVFNFASVRELRLADQEEAEAAEWVLPTKNMLQGFSSDCREVKVFVALVDDEFLEEKAVLVDV